jgi:ABC-type oligopeptide transport system substrate-binding subunit/DNA-binding SARP family transcriptional activator
MANGLEIYTLGGLRLFCDGEPISGIGSRKAEALLVYLACTGRAQSREVLADLLWDERSQRQALGNLRRELSALRRNLGEYLTITRTTAGRNPDASIWVDADELEATVHEMQEQERVRSPEMAERIERATMELYRGGFLEGFYVGDCPGIEGWQVRQRQRLGRLAADGLYELVAFDLESGAYQVGLRHAARLLELDPLMEAAHRRMMSLLAFCGQRGEALAQYETCRETLMSELGVEPEAETLALYQQIQAGELSTTPTRPITVEPTPPSLPAFLDEGAHEAEPPLFVSRQPEMERLAAALEQAVVGQGGVLFIAGGPGRGKTALLEAFARRALAAQPDLLVVRGICNAYTGAGDSYLPFRQTLGLLLGDVEAAWESDTVTTECAQRLWKATPMAIQALLEYGQGLVGSLVSTKEIVRRAEAAGLVGMGQVEEVWELVKRAETPFGELQRSSLLEQCAQVICEIAKEKPLLVLLDDLQWIDHGSIDLLLHLGRALAGTPLLLVGAYRPEELAVGRNADRHPLEKPLAEFKRQHGDVIIDLGRADEIEGRDFVEAYLDSQPNRLDESFRMGLHAHTGGHPLFTVELLRDLQARGDLLLDEAGRWVEGAALDWNVLPARVEGVIETRVGRLDGELRRILEVASVEGEQFSLQVLARVEGLDEGRLVRRLSGELAGIHRLVDEGGMSQVDGRRLYRYRFRHHLFQQHLYNGLGEIERRVLHQAVGEALEALYGDRAAEIAPQLARHFEAAEVIEKAIYYLKQAGDQARLIYAHQEAIGFYQRELTILERLGDQERASRTLMRIGLVYQNALDFRQAGHFYRQGMALMQQVRAVVQPHLSAAPHAYRNIDYEGGIKHYDIQHALFSGLVSATLDMGILPDAVVGWDVQPDMAQSWEMHEDGSSYVFHLREDVFWSDGRPVTAWDFESTWKRKLCPGSVSDGLELLYDLKNARAYNQKEIANPESVGVRALDATTLLVELEKPAGYFLLSLTNHGWFPEPRHVVDAYGEDWIQPDRLVTNGPFRMEQWEPGKSMTLVRNPNYHGHWRGNLEFVESRLISKPQAQFEAYAADEVDILFMDHFSTDLWRNMRQRYPDEYNLMFPDLAINFVIFETNRWPFDDSRVRQAFVMATDRKGWVRKVKGMDPRLISGRLGGLVPPGMPGFSPGIDLPYDPERARQLLAESGFPGGRGFPEIQGIISNFVVERMGNFCYEYLQDQWRQNLGVESDFEVLPVEIYRTELMMRSAHVRFGGWIADYPDPDNFLRVLVLNFIGWHNPNYLQLIEKASTIMDQGKRIEMYQQADRLLVQEAPLILIPYSNFHFLLKPWVKNLHFSGVQSQVFKDIIIEPH